MQSTFRWDAGRQHGAALVITLVVLAVLGVLAVGVITFTGRERVAAVQGTRAAERRSCVEAVRNAFLARVRTATPDSTKGFRLEVLDATEPARRSIGVTTHYAGAISGPPLTDSVGEPVAAGIGSQSRAQQNVSNRIVESGGGLSPHYRVTARCMSGGRETEMEFLVRFAF